MTPCNGKTALVTGASRGIGRAAALALAKVGAQVVVHDGRQEAEARSVVDQITALGGRAHAVGADLSDPQGAGAIAFLASHAARWVSGDTLRVDGGSRL